MNKNYIFLSLILITIFSITTIWYPYTKGFDYWEHSSAVREISRSPSNPTDTFTALKIPSFRYNPYTVIMGLFSRYTHIDVFLTMKIFAIINLISFIIIFYYFSKIISEKDDFPFYSLLFVIFFWGIGWVYSCSLQFKLLIHNIFNPSFVCLYLSLLSLVLFKKYMETKKLINIFFLLLIGYIVLLTHFTTFTFLYLLIILVYMAKCKKDVTTSLLIIVYPIILFMLSFLWKYYSFYDVFITVGNSGWGFWDISKINLYLGIGILPVLAVIYLYKHRDRFLAYGTIICSLIFLCYILFRFPIFGDRYYFFMTLFMQLVVAKKVSEIRDFSFWDKVLVVIIILSIILQIFLFVNFFRNYNNEGLGYKIDINELMFLKDEVNDYDTILTYPDLSYIIPSINGKAMGYRCANVNVLNKDYKRYCKDIITFFDNNTTIEERLDIIKEYQVDYILVEKADKRFNEYGYITNYNQFSLIKT